MWSFKSLEVVCRKDYVLKFQNFPTIEKGFQKVQVFFNFDKFLSSRLVQMKLQDFHKNN